MGLGNIFRNLVYRGAKDITDPKVWRTMTDWLRIKQHGLTIPADELESYAQQVVYRESQCPECVKAKECVHCHCAMPDKALVPNASCSAGKWGPMLPAAEWSKKVEADILEFITIQNSQ